MEVSYIQIACFGSEADAKICVLGCGRFFEGTAEEMHTALNKTLAAVPDDTKVYVCSSGSSKSLVCFADTLSPDTSTPKPMSNSASQFCKANL